MDKKRGSIQKKLAKNRTLLLMLVPAIIFVVIFSYLPMAGIVLAFKNYRYADGILGSPWTGLDNFKFLFITDDAWVITRNTLLYNVAFISFGVTMTVFAP